MAIVLLLGSGGAYATGGASPAPILVAPDPADLLSGDALLEPRSPNDLGLASYTTSFQISRDSLARADESRRRHLFETDRSCLADLQDLLERAVHVARKKVKGYTPPSLPDDTFLLEPHAVDSLLAAGVDPGLTAERNLVDPVTARFFEDAGTDSGTSARVVKLPDGRFVTAEYAHSTRPNPYEKAFEARETILADLHALHVEKIDRVVIERRIEQAHRAYEEGDWGRASYHFATLAAMQHPAVPELLFWAGDAARRDGDIPRARRLLDRVVTVDRDGPWAARASIDLNTSLADENRVAEPGDSMFDALAWLPKDDPEAVSAVLLRAKVLQRQRRSGEAADLLATVDLSHIDKTHGVARDRLEQIALALGAARASEGRIDDARRAYGAIDRSSLHRPEALLALAHLAANAGDGETAMRRIKELKGRYPESTEAVGTGAVEGICFERLGDSTRARERFRAMAERLRGVHEARIAARQGEEAQQALLRARMLTGRVLESNDLELYARWCEVMRRARLVRGPAMHAAQRWLDGVFGREALRETHGAVEKRLESPRVRQAVLRGLYRRLDEIEVRLGTDFALPPIIEHTGEAGALHRQVATLGDWREAAIAHLALDDKADGFDPERVPRGEREAWMQTLARRRSLFARSDSSAGADSLLNAEVVAHLDAWIAELIRRDETDRASRIGLRPTHRKSLSMFTALVRTSPSPRLAAASFVRIAEERIDQGTRTDLDSAAVVCEALLRDHPEDPLAPRALLLEGNLRLAGRRPDPAAAAPFYRRLLASPGAPLRREALYLYGWCGLREGGAQRPDALTALDRAARMPVAGTVAREGRISREALRELAYAFVPPEVEGTEAGFASADSFLEADPARISAYGFDLLRVVGDIYRDELGDARAAADAYERCALRFPDHPRTPWLLASRIELVEKQVRDLDLGYRARKRLFAAFGAGRGAGDSLHTFSAVDSLVAHHLYVAINIAAKKVIDTDGGAWLDTLREDCAAYLGRYPTSPHAPDVAYKLGSVLESLDSGTEYGAEAYSAYYNLVVTYPDSPLRKRAAERAWAVARNLLKSKLPSSGRKDEESDSLHDAARPDLDRLVAITALYHKAFPSDSLASGLMMNTALLVQRSGFLDEAAAEFDRLIEGYPGTTYAAEAQMAWLQVRAKQGKWNAVRTRAAAILAEEPGGRLARVAKEKLAEAMYAQAKGLQKQGKNDRAAALFSEAARVTVDAPVIPASLFAEGLLYADLDSLALARYAFERLVQDYPHAPQAAQAAFNLAMTLKKLQLEQLTRGNTDIGEFELAAAFERAATLDLTGEHALEYLYNAAEGYSLAGHPRDELRMRLRMVERFPDHRGILDSEDRIVRLATRLGTPAKAANVGRDLIARDPVSLHAARAHLLLGDLADDPDSAAQQYRAVLAVQDSLVKTGEGVPGYADQARLALIDLEAERTADPAGSWMIRRRLSFTDGTPATLAKAVQTCEAQYLDLARLPSYTGVQALLRVGDLEAGVARGIVAGMAGKATSTPKEIVARENTVAEAASHWKTAEGVYREVRPHLLHLQALRDSLRSQLPVGEETAPDLFGEESHLFRYPRTRPGKNPADRLSALADRRELEMLRAWTDAQAALLDDYLALPDAGSDIAERGLYRLKLLQEIVEPRIKASLPLLRQVIDLTGRVGGDTTAVQDRFAAVLSIPSGNAATWTAAHLDTLLPREFAKYQKAVANAGGASLPNGLSSHLTDLLDLSVDYGAYGPESVRRLLSEESPVDNARPEIQAVLLREVHHSLVTAEHFDQYAGTCRTDAGMYRKAFAASGSAGDRDAQYLCEDMARGWDDGALSVLEAAWGLLQARELQPQPETDRLVRALVVHDPVTYASLLGLEEITNDVVTDSSWTWTTERDGLGETVEVALLEDSTTAGRNSCPRRVRIATSVDTVWGLRTFAVDGRISMASVEITASVPYEMYLNGQFAAEGDKAAVAAGKPERWEVGDLVHTGTNRMLIALEKGAERTVKVHLTYSALPVSEEMLKPEGAGGAGR